MKPESGQNQQNLSDTEIADAFIAGLQQNKSEIKDSNIGKVLNAYRIEMKLGEGAMGKVYLARHELIGKLACVKICKNYENSSFDDRFLREAKILARLDHSNLITAFDFGQFDGGHYILMPYIKAMSLSELLEKNKSLSIEESVSMVIQAAKGLHAAHEVGVVHRDVKPGNLLVDTEGKVWVSDFGISFLSGATNSCITHTGETLGSPSYIAPEQIEGNSIDPRVDIYALGATLYHLICKTPPFKADNAIAVLRKHLDEELSIPSPLQQCPLALINCIKKMLAKKPEDRQQNMHEVAKELEQAMETPDTSFEATTIRLSEDTMLQIIERSHAIEKREKAAEDKLSRQDLYDIGEDLNIRKDHIEKARQEIENEKQQTAAPKTPAPAPISNKLSHAKLIDKLWVIQAISVLGLLIPIINLYVCELISLFMLWRLGKKVDSKLYPLIVESGKLAKISLICYCIAFPFGFFKFNYDPDVRLVAAIGGLFLIPCLVCSFMIVWKIFSTAIDMIKHTDTKLKERLINIRIHYILITIGFSIIGGTIIVLTPVKVQWLVTILLLPVGWFIGWTYILKPLKEVRVLLK